MNNINNILLKLFLSKKYFDKYHTLLNLEFIRNNNKSLFKIFLALFKLHEQSSEDASLDSLRLFFYTQYPNIKNEESVLVDATFDSLDAIELKEELALDYLKKQHEQSVANQIALAAVELGQGKGDVGTVLNLVSSLELPMDTAEELFVTSDLEILLTKSFLENGLRWRLDALNKSLGSLRQGDFGFLFARPETGKTTMLASEATYMAQQAKERNLGPVLWINNEEDGMKVMLRCYQAYFGITLQELATNLDHYKDKFNAELSSHLVIHDNAQVTRTKVEELCKKTNPSLIIFDQIDKIKWADSERYDLKMKAIYQWARELAKVYGAFIGICQAGGTGEGKEYLNMNDVDSSHTAKQGEADFIVGIGMTNKDGEEFKRGLSICKNKLSGDSDSKAELRHAKIPVLIKPEIARYGDIIIWEK